MRIGLMMFLTSIMVSSGICYFSQSARLLSNNDVAYVLGGQICNESALLDNACAPQQVTTACGGTACNAPAGAAPTCPANTLGTDYWNQAWSSDCSKADHGHWECPSQPFKCEQWRSCFGCNVVGGVPVCKDTNIFGGTPIEQDHYTFRYGCITS